MKVRVCGKEEEKQPMGKVLQGKWNHSDKAVAWRMLRKAAPEAVSQPQVEHQCCCCYRLHGPEHLPTPFAPGLPSAMCSFTLLCLENKRWSQYCTIYHEFHFQQHQESSHTRVWRQTSCLSWWVLSFQSEGESGWQRNTLFSPIFLNVRRNGLVRVFIIGYMVEKGREEETEILEEARDEYAKILGALCSKQV